eukprot:CAMPEP_0184292052 /NCGR_PEP_ID=MMETSP1049-20130417/3907_1 /TAXON_ID=77928 /ORGANISM="Proteomonas sulcata, Strain CCMP704" /LENGTH=320 /DNA_ID=CAMNT_0026599681 /DNA_START=34 /DNA_END=996 /DNA_ORIENTATION=-
MVVKDRGALTRALYRSVLREIRELAGPRKAVLLHQPLDPHLWCENWFPGARRITSPPGQLDILEGILPPSVAQLLRTFRRNRHPSPSDPQIPQPGDCQRGLTRDHFVSLARSLFRRPSQDTAKDVDVLDEAIAGIRKLGSQKARQRSGTFCFHEGLHLKSLAMHLPAESQRRGTSVFFYRISIYNEGPQTYFLKKVNWNVRDANGQDAEEVPRGSGKINDRTRKIPGGQGLEIVSAVDLFTPNGCLSANLELEYEERAGADTTRQVVVPLDPLHFCSRTSLPEQIWRPRSYEKWLANFASSQGTQETLRPSSENQGEGRD